MSELLGNRPESFNKKPVKVNINRDNTEPLGTGLSEGIVRRVDVEINNNRDKSHKIPMAEKTFDHPDITPEARQILIKKILDTHYKLRKYGLPTLPTMRTENGSDKIVMTDLTQRGKNEVISSPDWMKGVRRDGKFADTEHVVEISNITEIEKNLAYILERSVEAGCRLNMPDVFFLLSIKKVDWQKC